jgi:hypothetical protein
MDRLKLYNAICEQVQQIIIPPQEISELAKTLWEKDGSPESDGVVYWLKAESQLKSRKTADYILDGVIAPEMQNLSASFQDDSQKYTKNILNVLTQELLDNQKLVLPDGVRFHRRVGTHDYLVVEQPPMVRTINVDMQYHRTGLGGTLYANGMDRRGGLGESTQFRIALPYVVYQITLQDLELKNFQMGFLNKPLKTLKDELFLSPLPNTHANGTVCCPFERHCKNNIIDAINYVLGFYWQSQFRYNLHQILPSEPELKTWENWEKATLENPLFVLKTKWPKLNLTMHSILGDGIAANNNVKIPASFQDLSSKFIQSISESLVLKKPAVRIPAKTSSNIFVGQGFEQADDYD